MRKGKELCSPDSCLSKAHELEMLFVLRGHDVTAPAVIEFWISERIRVGKNKPDDPQILEARECIEAMREDQKKERGE